MGYRYRTKQKLIPYQTTQKWVSGGTSFTPSIRGTITEEESKAMSDFVIPGWNSGRRNFGSLGSHQVNNRWAVKRSFFAPVNPLEFTVWNRSEAISHETVKDNFGKRTWTLDGNCTQWLISAWSATFPALPAPILISDQEEMTAEAKRKALSHFNRPKHAFGEPIAELRKTVVGIKPMLFSIDKATRTLHKAYKDLRSKVSWGSKLPRDVAEHAADLWLNYAMAIRPSVQATGDAINAYVESCSNFRKFPDTETALGTMRVTIPPQMASGSYSSAGWSHRREITREGSYEVKAGIFYQVFDAASRDRFLGVRMGDLVNTGWQVMPWSFLVDRMFNVRQFLHAGTALLDTDVKIVNGFVTSRRTTKTSKRFSNRIASGANLWTPKHSQPFVEEQFVFARSRWVPELSDAIPRLKPFGLVSDLTSTLDTVSIIIKRLRGREIAGFQKT